jgi:hypothetical protein
VAEVRVPKTPKKAFDRTRRPSSLLLGQIEHLEWAVLPAFQRKPDRLPTEKVKTEAQAAERVAQLMNMLRQSGAAPAAARAAAGGTAPAAARPVPVILPPLPKVATPAKAKARPKNRPANRTRKNTKSAPRRRSSR